MEQPYIPDQFKNAKIIITRELNEIIDSRKYGFDIVIEEGVLEIVLFTQSSTNIDHEGIVVLTELVAEFIEAHAEIKLGVEVVGDKQGSYYIRLHKK